MYWIITVIVIVLQRERGALVLRVDGKVYDPITKACDDVWRTRRRILTPAFSAHKMKLVSAFC